MDLLGTVFGALFGLAFFAGIPGYFVLQTWTLFRFADGWRKAALLPLLGAIPTIFWSLYALSQGSNLWPLTFIFFAPMGAFYLAGLMALHHFARRRAAA
jgi:hypothetical protein